MVLGILAILNSNWFFNGERRIIVSIPQVLYSILLGFRTSNEKTRYGIIFLFHDLPLYRFNFEVCDPLELDK